MDHLDLAGVLTTPPQWNLPAFEQQDAIYLSSSRQMLEPIMEETSEDEEYALNSWQQYEQQGSDNEGGATTEGESVCGATSGAGGASFWSSAESDTGSVIRIEVTKDNDSNSERDFLCPAKRPRRCEESLAQSLPEEEVILRRPLYGVEKNNSLERFLNYENFSRDSWGTNSQQRSSVGSRRGFDDFYSDSDSLSYNSLSRSSSLIQFESLERQLLMQEQHVSMNSLGNSSPSLMSFDNNEETGNKLLNNSGNNSANNSRRGSQSSLMKKYESLDGRLHQTYYDLDKLNFDDMDHSSGDNFARNGNLKVASHLAELRSDSESSSEGSEGTQSVLSPADINDNEFLFKKFTRTNSQQNKKGKSSAENLSEDSGYCEPAMGFGLRRSKSQSLLKNYEKFSEEEEEMENKSLIHMEQQQTTATTTEFKNTNTRHHHQQQQETPPHSPQLEYIRHKQRTEAHSPSPVSSEVSTSSSSSSSSSACSQHSSSSSTSSSSTASTSSSATTCASKASFTWLMPTANATTAGAVRQLPRVQADQQLHSPTHFSLNDLCVVKTSNEENAATQIEKEFSSLTRSTTSNDHCGERQCKENISSKEYSNSEKSKSIEEVEYNSELKINYWKNGEKFLEEEEEQKLIVQTLNKERVRKECSAKAKSGEFNNYVFNINNFPKSLTTSCPNTPEFWRAKDRDYTPLSLSKVYDNLMPSWPVKTSSVPSELCNLGRKKKLKRAQQTKTSLEVDCPNSEPLTDNDSLAESLTSLEDLQTLKRSLSWCSCTQNSGDCNSFTAEAKNLALLHRSYHNLASLDIDLEEQETMAERRISSDYETEIICKNNFLLDELSAHYERTASILNDKPLEDNDVNKPLKPDRSQARKSSNSSYSQGEESESEQVQHVQLVIRKPPARQKRANGQQLAQEKANSLTQDFSFQAIMQSGPTKTFDQDPTILKTSYAQSLEKCNFDCKELSNQNLNKTRSIPKRRFHSQANYAKKKNLVSSTPNLNAYDFQHQDDIEDDMFVSSAHNSMHQLPLSQTQKPLGILLPAGSRTSFGKEVSFCPVVSKYCWQEQSSEECNEGLESEGQGEEESEDELLDNADATVIYNTKENENIAAKYNEEFLKKEQPKTEQEIEIIKEKAVMKEINKQKVEKIIKESTIEREEEQERENEKLRDGETKGNETLEKIKQREETLELENTQTNETQEQMENLKQMELLPQLNVSLTTNVNNETLKTQTPDAQNINETKSVNNKVNNNTCLKTKPTVVVARPLSIQLPILTEPPINRAHHILYASQQMLDNFQRQQQNEENEHFNKSQSTQNLSNKMSSKTKELKQSAAPPPSNQAVNNNNDIMKSKFKHEEKHPNSKGFLTRFANGFRFSLRRNKKKLPKDQQQVEQLETNAVAKENKTKSLPAAHKQADFIHIPLKGPLPENRINQNKQTNGNAVNAKQKTAKTNNNDKVTGKPPIPPQQQQQLLKMQSAQSSPQPSQQPLVEVGLSRFYTETENNPTLPFNPQQTTQDFLNGEKQALYHEHAKQSCANLKQETPENVTEMMSVNSNNTTYEFNNSSSPSRASVSQKTQMFNNLSRQSVPQQQQNQQQPKIGLIETNLDTHETIITGKTRSLINIGPNQQPQQSRFAGNKRLHTNAHHNHTYNHHQYQHHHRHHHHDGNEADDDDYDDNDDDEVVVRPDGTVVVIKNAGSNGSTASQTAQIVSVRRPHKSMEFLLDKENQKDVMPPENELQKSHDHNPAALSEHQLRIQASLQRLNIPDWFRQYNQNQKSPDGAGTGAGSAYKPGNFTRKRTQDSGRWVGLNSKTTSLSSLGSQRSDRSPLLLSPSAHSHHGGQSTQHAGQHVHAAGTTGTGASGGAFSRWSTSHLNSSQTSPSVSQRGSFSRGGPINSSFMSVNSGHSVIRNSMRQPYLGWRSQEKLSQRTAHERLASSLLSQQQRTSPTSQTVPANNDKLQPVTPEIQSSIKEVTSAIVHYVNDQTNQQRSRSTSPNSRKCWLESSFVGTRPLDSPQTPIIENTPLITAAQAAASTLTSSFRPSLLNNNNNNINNNNNNLQYANHNIDLSTLTTSTGNDLQLTRMNGGLNNGTSSSSAAGGVNLGVGGVLVSESQTPNKQQTQQHHMPQKPQPLQQLQLQQQQQQQQQKENLLTISKEEQQRLRRRSEGDAATKQKQQQQQQEQQQQQFEQKSQHYATNAKTYASDTITTVTNTNTTANGHAIGATAFLPPRRVSLGDSSESNNRTASASGELQIKCRNNKCDRTATPADAKKYYKSCHNCTYLYCSRECRRAHWEKHRKACLHSRVSNLCRQVLASCKDDSDSLRHLSLLARKGFLSQGRGVVRILFRSPESAEGFIKNGFQCMGEASYVRWPDLMPAEMGLELYSELLKLSTEYRPDSKMLVYVAVCVVSEAPGMGQAPVRWERQLVSRCAKLKLCKTVLAELEQQQQPLPLPVTVVAVPEPTTEVLILTFNPQLRNSTAQRELVLSNILDILSRRGVILRKHYPEIFQRLQTYTEGQTDKFNPVTLHPRDSHTGQNFVCIIMPVQSETEIIKLPSIADGGNRVTTIDVGSTAALAQLDDDELLTRTATLAS